MDRSERVAEHSRKEIGSVDDTGTHQLNREPIGPDPVGSFFVLHQHANAVGEFHSIETGAVVTRSSCRQCREWQPYAALYGAFGCRHDHRLTPGMTGTSGITGMLTDVVNEVPPA